MELCPTCDGDPERVTWICGRRGCDTLVATCPLCEGTGSIPAGRSSWPLLGERLRLHRERNPIGWTTDGDRLVYTTDPSVPLRPEPPELAAGHYGISVAHLTAIEAGLADPRIVARRLRWAYS